MLVYTLLLLHLTRLEIAISGLYSLKDHSLWCIEQNVFKENLSRLINDAELVEYHAIAHAVSIASQNSDVLEVYRFASHICQILFHLSSSLLNKSCKKAVAFLCKELNAPKSYIKEVSQGFPRETILLFLLEKIRIKSKNSTVSLTEDLIWTLMPFWTKEKFIEDSHKEFKLIIQKISKYKIKHFQKCSSALISNNLLLLNNICDASPHCISSFKRPPIFCGDFILSGSSEFDQLEKYFMDIKVNDLEKMITIEEKASFKR
ncbi:hypothetical protein [[Leptolyngbya] sp. PCC 7376]|uniref:hypothetical protein n=1 Tax=[Leptolyngbya] sp. PCC 7376 TaxID=111781 RepID=UPI0002FE36F2|nr:hypothetical protein [[Leptolyngbya] sp. PCC 7376]